LGPAGMDSQYGSGALNLGALPGATTATPTSTSTSTSTSTAGATATSTRTPTATSTPAPSSTPGPLAQMLSPVPGSLLISSNVTFTWTAGTAASQYWLWVGTSLGASDLYSQVQGTSTSATVGGVPTGVPTYARLWSLVGSNWQYVDYGYGPGAIQPTPRPS